MTNALHHLNTSAFNVDLAPRSSLSCRHFLEHFAGTSEPQSTTIIR